MPTRSQLNKPSSAQDQHLADVVSSAEVATAAGEGAPSPLRTLLARARRTSYDAQDILYHQSAEADTVFFITAGLLKLVTTLPNGRMRIVRLHRPGSVLGLSGMLGQDNEHTAVAVTPVTVLRLPLVALQRLRDEDPTTYASLVERWHGYLKDADTWITEFSTGPIRGRVARLLTFLSEFEPEAAEGHVQLLTCEEMASILGVTTESVSRILAEFKRQRILVSSEDEPTECYEADMGRLRHIAEQE